MTSVGPRGTVQELVERRFHDVDKPPDLSSLYYVAATAPTAPRSLRFIPAPRLLAPSSHARTQPDDRTHTSCTTGPIRSVIDGRNSAHLQERPVYDNHLCCEDGEDYFVGILVSRRILRPCGGTQPRSLRPRPWIRMREAVRLGQLPFGRCIDDLRRTRNY